MHYASHHHVLEKLMMFESEQQCVKYRNMITELEYEMKRIKEKMENLKEKMEDQKEKIEDQQDQMEEQKENEMRREEEMKREEDLRREKEKSIRLIEKMETDPNPVLIIVKEDEEEEEEEEKEQTTAQDARTIIKMETAAVTNIENQTLKMEFLQLKMEKEKLEQMLETRTLELEQLRADSKENNKEMAKDQKKTVDMCKEWKEVCLAEEEKHKNEIKELKERISGQGKEIQNLKNIIEIGKSTVEHAKQLSTDLAKDNKKRQLKAAEYEMHCKKYQDHIQKLEQEKDANLKEIENLSEIVRFQHDSIETRTNENIQLYEDYKEMTNKYESLLEGIKGKDAEISTLRTEVEIGKSLSKENTDQLEESLKKALADKQVAEMKSRNEAENLCRNIREKGDQLKQVQDGLNKVTKELEEKKRELRSLTTELKDSKEKKEFYLAQCSELERSEKAIKQELEKLRKVVDGQKITKNQMENIQRKYDQDRDTMIADIQKYKDSRDHFEAQTTILLTDMDHLKSKLQKVEKMEEEKKEIIKELELANRSKNNLINQLQEESRQNKMKLDKFEDISNMFNSKSRNEEELRRKCEKMSAELKVQGWEIEIDQL
ncbi:golgin subfamily A member 6-like protein 22 [Eurytemora carolleeae]|uniref:golgin subfamily A member 6-like protein 22 n=1 Tax=Eurytemora carolleeae TaxID=1294199 RepID=UPI000C765F6F|nr:golgin subfamily A member 6-like protein 22 [Eurytemora carolleeae]|eukprot:XP_023344995.1 golgin subfamily A member 6-like protein 22 [Eurytemora affinis]